MRGENPVCNARVINTRGSRKQHGSPDGHGALRNGNILVRSTYDGRIPPGTKNLHSIVLEANVNAGQSAHCNRTCVALKFMRMSSHHGGAAHGGVSPSSDKRHLCRNIDCESNDETSLHDRSVARGDSLDPSEPSELPSEHFAIHFASNTGLRILQSSTYRESGTLQGGERPSPRRGINAGGCALCSTAGQASSTAPSQMAYCLSECASSKRCVPKIKLLPSFRPNLALMSCTQSVERTRTELKPSCPNALTKSVNFPRRREREKQDRKDLRTLLRLQRCPAVRVDGCPRSCRREKPAEGPPRGSDQRAPMAHVVCDQHA